MKRLNKKLLGAAALLSLSVWAGVGAYGQSTATSRLVVANGLTSATGVTVDPSGNLYYTDGGSGQANELVGANGSNPTLLSVTLSGASQMAVDSNLNLYVAGGAAHVAYKFAYQNGALNVNNPVSLGTGLGTVSGVAVDFSGNVYLSDTTNKTVVEISNGTQTTVMTGLTSPQQIAVDKSGGLYVADSGANAVYYMAPGQAAVTLGSGLNHPMGVAVDAAGDLYIADTGAT